jgi:hypothetical protein
MGPKKTKTEKLKTKGNELLKAIAQARTDIIKDLAPMFENIEGKFLDVNKKMDQKFDSIDKKFDLIDKRFDTVDHRLSVITSDIHEMKQEISTAMEIPDNSLRQEATIKEHDERITKLSEISQL